LPANAQSDGTFQARQFKQLSVRISLWNDSLFSAKEPRVIVRLNAMALTAESDSQFQGGWTVLDVVDTVGITGIEWEGGPGYSIHPNSVRRLPGFYLNNLRWKQEWGNPGFIIEVLLDNLRTVFHVPANFEFDDELFAWEEAERGAVARPWLPPPKEKRGPGPQVYVYTELPDHQQERQASSGADA
jgi:hypothetical protein